MLFKKIHFVINFMPTLQLFFQETTSASPLCTGLDNRSLCKYVARGNANLNNQSKLDNAILWSKDTTINISVSGVPVFWIKRSEGCEITLLCFHV